jgi:hypothetical protein
MSNNDYPLWQKVLAALYMLIVIGLVVLFRSHLHADFIPIDHSNIAPNILASVIIVIATTPVVVLIWPPTRRRIHRFIDRKLGGLHTKLDSLHAKHDQLLKSHDELKASHHAMHEMLKDLRDSGLQAAEAKGARPVEPDGSASEETDLRLF